MAISPSRLTGIGGAWVSKNFLPRVFVVEGPVKLSEMYTGLLGAASSSSVNVGRRGVWLGGNKWLR